MNKKKLYTISRNGDLINNMYTKINLPSLVNYNFVNNINKEYKTSITKHNIFNKNNK